jgi:hypothetical protein
MLVAVAVIAAFLVPLRADQDAKPNPAPGLTLVAASVVCMALVRTHDVISRRQDPAPPTLGQWARIFLKAMVGAVTIAGLSILAFLAVYAYFRLHTPKVTKGPYPPKISTRGYIIGTLVAVGFASLLRRLIWDGRDGERHLADSEPVPSTSATRE